MLKKIAIGTVAAAAMGVGGFFARHRLGEAIHTVGTADPNWLFAAAACFIVATVAAAGSWRCAVGNAGGETSLPDACARYGAGSLVNTFVPFRAGDAVRIALFSRLVPHRQRVRSTTGAFAAIGAARAVVLIALVAAGAMAGAVPLWPLLVLAGMVAIAAGAALFARRHQESHFLDAFRNPRALAPLIGWMIVSTVARYGAAATACAALGIKDAFAAAIIILPALDVAGLLPLMPGNVGTTSGAIAVALKAHHVSFHSGLAAGIAFHAVETAVGLLFGVAAAVWFAPAVRLRRRLPSAV